jgi:hypothetical protein
MNALLPEYECRCPYPHPQMEKGQDSGLCQSCGGIYDIRLYEARLRQYTPNYRFESVHDYLMVADPNYRALAESQSSQ